MSTGHFLCIPLHSAFYWSKSNNLFFPIKDKSSYSKECKKGKILLVKKWQGKLYNFKFSLSQYLVLINRAGGLYGRILTEVASTDRTQ